MQTLENLTKADRRKLLDFVTRSLTPKVAAPANSLRPREHGGLVPLSYAQQRLWFLSQTARGSRAYHVPFGVELRGKVEVGALCRALDRIVERHEALRTTFEQVEGEPRQRVREAEPFHLVQEDVRGCRDPKLEVRERAKEEVGKAFDLERGPVIRGRLLQHGEEAYTLLVTVHHIAFDGWSMGIFWRELGELYGAFSRGEADGLSELPVQYADYAVWQRSEAVAEEMEKQGQYWERVLRGAPAMLELPMDRPRPAQQEYAGGAIRIELDAELTKGLKELSQRAGTTLFMTVLGGWMAVLGRLARQEDVVVGTPVANRGHEQIEGLIGFFVNALALRVEVRGELRVRELLEGVKGRVLEAQQNQEIPFEQVVERVRPERSLAHSPIFQTVFTWQNNEGGRTLNLPGIEVGASEAAAHIVSKFDLSLVMRERGEGIAGTLEYATSLFDEATVRRMMGYLRTMLAGMVEDEGREIGSIGLLTGEEREQVLEEWNDTSREMADSTLPELFEQQVERTPDAVAVVHGEQSVSYRELNERANRLAHYLRRLGVRLDARVAICVERGVEMVVGLLAVLKAGGAYVPLDPEYPAERLRLMLEDSGSAVLLTERSLWGVFSDLTNDLSNQNLSNQGMTVVDLKCAEVWSHEGERNLERSETGVTPESLAYVIYTSGSTGIPKGSEVPHRSIPGFIFGVDYVCFNEETVFLQHSSVNWDGLTLELWSVLLTGGRSVLAQQRVTSEAEIREYVEEGGVNTICLTTALLNAIVDSDVRCLEGVKYLLTGGETASVKHIKRAMEELPEMWVVNGYGPSECTVFCNCYVVPEKLGEEVGSLPIGKAIGDRRVYVLDRWMNPAPIGVVGEAYVGGASVARGYLGRAEMTGEKFVPDPLSRRAGMRIYKTGDLVQWQEDGNLKFIGRVDDQVKVRGYRVELGEIEAALEREEGVEQAAGAVKGDESGGKGWVGDVVGEAGGGRVEGGG